MAGSRTRHFVRDNSAPALEVDYSVRMTQPPEVNVSGAWLWSQRNNPDAPLVELAEAERERFDDEVLQDPTTWEPEDDYD